MATESKSASSQDDTEKTPAKKSAAKRTTAKTSPAKKTAAKKSPAKKTASKKTASKKAPAKKTATKKTSASESRTRRSDAQHEQVDGGEQTEQREQREQQAPAKKIPAMKVAGKAAQQLAALTGREPEAVIGIRRTEDGWEVELEVVESRRIPDSTDILATYRVETDEQGDLMGYQRVRRYVRGKGGDDGGGR
jgi:hypothetical protein